MKPVLTPEEARTLDRETQARGVPAGVLMERAGWAVARAAMDVIGGAYGRRAVVVCGAGNNGGDGFVAARHLERAGVRTAVVTLAGHDALTGLAAEHRARLASETAARILPFAPETLARELARADVAVDAIFGIGFHGVPSGDEAAAIELVNAGAAPVVAVDLPSGVDGATGAAPGAAIRAALTVSFGAAKVGAVLLPGAELAGDVRVVDIGFPEDLVPTATGLTEPADVAAVLPERAPDSHKKASGTLLVVAGSRDMTGAVRLVARAAGRVGAGYVIVAVPASILPVVQADLSEAVFVSLPETASGTIAAGALELLLERAAGVHAIAIGPGLTTDEGTAGVVRDLVRISPVPVVLDADGLNAFAADPQALADRASAAVLTPHLGELARLRPAGPPAPDRLTAARDLADAAGAVALVKGTRTAIAEPGGRARINPTGTPALATAGTGDVLTGAIGGLLARGVAPFAAAWAGAYLHGLAGMLAAGDEGEGVLAGDVADRLPEAIALVGRQA